MKKLSLAILLAVVPLSAHAASCTIPNGSIAIVYVNAEGVCTYSPYASISDATAAVFISWCQANYHATAAAATAQGCYNTWANDHINQTIAAMTAASKAAATATAAAAVTPPAITPAQ